MNLIDLSALLKNNIYLIIILAVSVITNLILKRFKINLKKITIFSSFLGPQFFFFSIYYEINYILFIHNFFITIIFFFAYEYMLIGVLDQSPTLSIIKTIIKKKTNLSELKKKFLKENFINKRINNLIRDKYIFTHKDQFVYKKKTIIFIKFLNLIQNYLNINNKKNG
jgi:hypothetical protein